MAYQRRYFPALTITTISYGEKSVTTDKLADKAVTSPKVAPDTIDSEHVVDESLKSEDIKDGEIKTVDIASGAITTDKIASQAVTVDKLEASIQGIARPLTPGVDTAEIQDGKVTLAKLAPDSVDASKIKPGAVGPTELAVDAVEESRVKDGAISRDKIAGGAIDATKIAVDAVTSSEILNRSVGHLEIAVNGVEAENIKALNVYEAAINNEACIARTIGPNAVTEPKLNSAALSRRHIESKDIRVITHFEEFGGIEMSNKWQKIGAAGGYVLPAGRTGVKIATGAVNGDDQRIDWDAHYIGLPEDLHPILNMWISARHASLNYLTQNLGLWNNANNHIVFYAHDVAGATPNWFAKCVSLGAATSIDTGVPIAASIQVLSIEVISGASIKFYIDGIEVAEVTTNIPTTFHMEPRLEIITRTGVLRWFDLKYFSLLAKRPDYV